MKATMMSFKLLLMLVTVNDNDDNVDTDNTMLIAVSSVVGGIVLFAIVFTFQFVR